MKNLIRIRIRIITIAGAALVALAGCSTATQDRPDSAGGKEPDAVKSATHVTVYLNSDNVPNVVIFCTDDMAWGSTLSGGDSGKDKASSLIRLPEKDGPVCGTKAK